MKILFFLLLLVVSCTKAKFQEIPGGPGSKASVNALRIESQDYSRDIDLLVAFLWPEKIENDWQRNELREIITASRKLKVAKEKFQEKRFELKAEYNRLDCPCILEFRCSGEETHNDEEACLELENKIYENDKDLPSIYALVDVMKEKVVGIGGEWLQTNLDYPETQLSSFNFKTLELDLKVFGASNDLPLQYLFIEPIIFEDADFQLLTYTSPRKESTGEWRLEVTPYKTKASLLFQGELFFNDTTKERRGFILWEHSMNP